MVTFYLILNLVLAASVLIIGAVCYNFKCELKLFKEKFCEQGSRLSSEIVNMENKLNILSKRVDDIPIEEMVMQQKQEEQFFNGLQNIFNYGGEVPKLNLEAIRRE